MIATRLRTEDLVEPLGLGNPKPRLSWNCEGGLRQTAYRIVAEREECGGKRTHLWDTGRVASDRMVRIPYAGEALGSRDRVEWRVALWDEDGREGAWSAPAHFELGLLEVSDWKASWITGDYAPKRGVRHPVDSFRRSFRVDGPVARARLYATACGIYVPFVNGRDAGTWRYAPGFTDYRKRIHYQTHDVTELLVEGENALAIDLADGWYRGSVGAHGARNVFGTRTKLLAQLEITTKDGRRTLVFLDEGTAWSCDGPVREGDLKDGEVVDARLAPSYAGRARRTSHPIVPTASDSVPVEAHERFTPALLTTPKGAKVLDFGQNLAGTVEFAIEARAGQTVRLRVGETLDVDGEFTQANFQIHRKRPTPRQEIRYVCRDGLNEYRCRYGVFGFRYALVETEVPFRAEDFTAVAVYSSMEETGSFHCSNPLVDRFVENVRWSMKGNFLDVPTDCPTRERAGWTGDAQIFFTTGAYLCDTAAFFRKWMRDLTDRQTRKGKVHCIVPTVGTELFIARMDGCVGWADAAVLVPYRFRRMFADRSVLVEHYDAMARYGRFMIGRTGRTGLFGRPVRGSHRRYVYNVGQGFGEWLEPQDVHRTTLSDLARPQPEEGTAYLALTMGLLAEIAADLGHPDDASLFAEYRDGARRAYQALFATDALLATDRPSKLVRPLAFGLLDEPVRTSALDRLLALIAHRDHRIGTGFLSTPLILPLLSDSGFLEDAYRMLEQEESPGWLHEVKRGATTVWEDWEGKASLNHYSPGSACEWLFSTVGGLRPDGCENRFLVAPRPGGTLLHADASWRSVFGTVSCRWARREDGRIDYEIVVPSNMAAEVRLPDGTSREIGSGTHRFTA